MRLRDRCKEFKVHSYGFKVLYFCRMIDSRMIFLFFDRMIVDRIIFLIEYGGVFVYGLIMKTERLSEVRRVRVRPEWHEVKPY